MATNYPGVETNTQPPSVTPGINTVPTVVLPDDGDPLNAASVAQAYKALADHGAYVNRVHHFRKTANDDVALLRSENFASKLRWAFDHNGFPVNRTRYSNEDFLFYVNQVGTSGGLIRVPEYGKYQIDVTANARIRSHAASQATAAGFTGIEVSVITAAANEYALLTRGFGPTTVGPILLGPASGAGNQSTALSWETNATTVFTNVFIMQGLRNDATSIAAPDVGHQAVFYKTSADANWQCRTANGATATTTDSGVAVAAGTNYSMRIEHHGSATSYGARTVRFFINGSLVATHTTNLPAETSAYSPLYQTRATGAASLLVVVANEQLAHNYLDNPSAL